MRRISSLGFLDAALRAFATSAAGWRTLAGSTRMHKSLCIKDKFKYIGREGGREGGGGGREGRMEGGERGERERECVCVCVCVCERERERERERETEREMC